MATAKRGDIAATPSACYFCTVSFEEDRLEGRVRERAGLIGEMAVKGQGQH